MEAERKAQNSMGLPTVAVSEVILGLIYKLATDAVGHLIVLLDVEGIRGHL